MSGITNQVGARSGVIGSGGGIGYEEGLFTGVFHDSGGTAGGMSASQTTGFYTKIGRTVTICGRFECSGLGSMTTSDPLFLSGLPFPPNTTSYNAMTAGSVSHASGLAISAGQYANVYTDPSSGKLKFKLWDVTTGTSDFLVSELSADGAFVIGMTYQT